MKTNILAFGLACAAGAALATPTVTGVSLTQDDDHLVTVSYNLDQTAIVTVSFSTNGVDIGAKNYADVGGEVNRIISAGDRKIFWRPEQTWPGHLVTNVALKATVKAWALDCPPDYMFSDVTFYEPKRNFFFYESADALPCGGITNRQRYIYSGLLMRKIPAAGVQWRMGATTTMLKAIGHDNNIAYKEREIPHYVTLTKDYYLGVFELTQRQARNYWGYKDGSDAAVYKPIVTISWNEIRGSTKGVGWPESADVDDDSLVGKVRSRTGFNGWDLPTMAQWEFAYRAGRGTNFYNGSDEVTEEMQSTTRPYGWANSIVSAVQPVGLLEPNPWGLYDMSGNAFEWCLDWFWQRYYNDPQGSDAENPKGPATSASVTTRVVRGGTVTSAFADATASNCSMLNPSQSTAYIGLRLCCPADFTELAD